METQTEPQNGHAAEEPGQAVADEVEAARKALEDLNQKAVAFIKERPGACVAGALVVGFVLGRILSRR
jgi:ElaB/YqjD/DUF883 family membrane-anchored ribosome-binding protein